eukprot:TRINITY_DN2301_c1_g3_i1.p1 TRINITY_DN2301_c1_g3~~TRINITY_DN2301_c1_g3_i1.p1  ORF type:complete len:420 (+),score=68.99 TRINITY_DN2301_c1_g3_i1:37-1296(+)
MASMIAPVGTSTSAAALQRVSLLNLRHPARSTEVAAVGSSPAGRSSRSCSNAISGTAAAATECGSGSNGAAVAASIAAAVITGRFRCRRRHPVESPQHLRRSSTAAVGAGFGELDIMSIAKEYPAVALHPELFKSSKVEDWLLPEVLETLAAWRKSGNFRDVEVDSLPGLKVEAPGVFSFDLLKPETCASLLEEVNHYTEESGFPAVLPNSMNKDGLILGDIGLRLSFMWLMRKYLIGISAHFFGDDDHRAEKVLDISGDELGTENWGGSTLSEHHTFVVKYKPDGDQSLAMHVDESDITFNIGLLDGGLYEGGDLAFCGMFGDVAFRKQLHTYRHKVGRCVVHAGKRRHGVLDVVSGERASLIMWTKSLLFRETQEYKEKCGDFATGRRPLPEEIEGPDPICLSMRHDQDYLRWAHLL